MIISLQRELFVWAHYIRDASVYKEHRPGVSFANMLRFLFESIENVLDQSTT